MKQVQDYQICVVNDASTSENRIHSDEIARKYGFTGALVSGVSVFGYLTHPLIASYGEDWLRDSVADVKFIKPAYVDDLLTIKTQWLDGSLRKRHHMTSAYNEAGVLLAQLESWQRDALSGLNNDYEVVPGEAITTREVICWEKIRLNQPAPDYSFTLDSEQQQLCLSIMRDNLALYQEQPDKNDPCLHPYYLLKECNQALMRMFLLPAWIHVGSRAVFYNSVRVGQTVTVQTIPIDKWERKGHQFVKLLITMSVDKQKVLQTEHSAIFKIAA